MGVLWFAYFLVSDRLHYIILRSKPFRTQRAALLWAISTVLMLTLLLKRFICFLSYGDKAPKSAIARIFSVFWILFGVILIAIFTADVTSSLTAASLKKDMIRLNGLNVSMKSYLKMFLRLFIAGLHITSWRPCWWSRTMVCLSARN